MSMLDFSVKVNQASRMRDAGFGAFDIAVPIELVMFLNSHIHLLEEQLGASQDEVHKLRQRVNFLERL